MSAAKLLLATSCAIRGGAQRATNTLKSTRTCVNRMLPRTPRSCRRCSLTAAAKRSDEARALLDNVRLLQTALKDTRDFDRELRKQPVVTDASGAEQVRAVVVARDYLAASE